MPIVGTKYLSQIVKPEMLKHDELNIIKSPTGSGKTYFALTAIPSTVPDPAHKIVYLIDTINGKEQILQNYNARPLYHLWTDELEGINFDNDMFETNQRIVIITYAKFGVLLDRDPDFHRHFDYIICDELHSLIKFQYFSKQPNYHSIAKRGLERAVRNDHTKVVALTATPTQVENEFDTPKHRIPLDDNEVIHYETKQVIHYTNIDEVLKRISLHQTGLLYVSHITTMKTMEQTAREMGFNPVSVWSISNTDHEMTQEQLSVREQVLKHYTLPPEYNLFIINASSETSIKIKSPMDYAIVHSGDEDTQVQVRGRINNDLSRLYLPAKDNSIVNVPDYFQECPLYREDKQKLCEVLNLRNESGRLCGWTTVKRRIVASGYKVTEGRKGNYRFTVISDPV